MEIEENQCTICSKICKNVFSTECSLIYFNLLNEIYGSIPNFTQNEDILQKHICIECSQNIDTVSQFLKIISKKTIDSRISSIQCRLCEEETDCLFTIWDLSDDLQEKMEFFIKIVLEKVVYEPSWQICLPCSASIIFWSDFRKIVIKSDKSDINAEVVSRTQDENINCENNSVIINDISNNNVNINIERLSLNGSLSNLKTVSDFLTFKNLWKLKYEIVTNKQLMVEKPYVRLEKFNFEDYTCSWCRKAFTSIYKATMHELRHGSCFLPKVRLSRIPNNQIESNLHGSKSKVTCKEQWCYNILPVCETVYSDEENLGQNVISDAIVIDDSDNDSEENIISNPMGSNKMIDHNYNKPYQPPTQKSNYLGAFNSWLTKNVQKPYLYQYDYQYSANTPQNQFSNRTHIPSINVKERIEPQINHEQQVYTVGRQTPTAATNQYSLGQNSQGRPVLIQGPNGQLLLCHTLPRLVNPGSNNLLHPESKSNTQINNNTGTHFLVNQTPLNRQINNTGTHFLDNREPRPNSQINNVGTHFLVNQEPSLNSQINNVGTHFLVNREPSLNSQINNVGTHFLVNREPKLNTGTHFLASLEPNLNSQINNTGSHLLLNQAPTPSIRQNIGNHFLATSEPNSQTAQDTVQFLLNKNQNSTNPTNTNTSSSLSQVPHFLLYRQTNGVVHRVRVPLSTNTLIQKGLIKFPANLVKQNGSQEASISNVSPNLNNPATDIPISNSIDTQFINHITEVKNTNAPVSQNLDKSSSNPSSSRDLDSIIPSSLINAIPNPANPVSQSSISNPILHSQLSDYMFSQKPKSANTSVSQTSLSSSGYTRDPHNQAPNLTNLSVPVSQVTLATPSSSSSCTTVPSSTYLGAPDLNTSMILVNQVSNNSINQFLDTTALMSGSKLIFSQANGSPFTQLVPQVTNNNNNNSHGSPVQINTININNTRNEMINNEVPPGSLLKEMLSEKLKLITKADTEDNSEPKALRVRTDLF